MLSRVLKESCIRRISLARTLHELSRSLRFRVFDWKNIYTFLSWGEKRPVWTCRC